MNDNNSSDEDDFTSDSLAKLRQSRLSQGFKGLSQMKVSSYLEQKQKIAAGKKIVHRTLHSPNKNKDRSPLSQVLYTVSQPVLCNGSRAKQSTRTLTKKQSTRSSTQKPVKIKTESSAAVKSRKRKTSVKKGQFIKQEKTPVRRRGSSGDRSGRCPVCQVPFTALSLVQSTSWHIDECLDTPYLNTEECPHGEDCDSMLVNHYKKYRHTQLAKSSRKKKERDLSQVSTGNVNIAKKELDFEDKRPSIRTLKVPETTMQCVIELDGSSDTLDPSDVEQSMRGPRKVKKRSIDQMFDPSDEEIDEEHASLCTKSVKGGSAEKQCRRSEENPGANKILESSCLELVTSVSSDCSDSDWSVIDIDDITDNSRNVSEMLHDALADECEHVNHELNRPNDILADVDHADVPEVTVKDESSQNSDSSDDWDILRYTLTQQTFPISSKKKPLITKGADADAMEECDTDEVDSEICVAKGVCVDHLKTPSKEVHVDKNDTCKRKSVDSTTECKWNCKCKKCEVNCLKSEVTAEQTNYENVIPSTSVVKENSARQYTGFFAKKLAQNKHTEMSSSSSSSSIEEGGNCDYQSSLTRLKASVQLERIEDVRGNSCDLTGRTLKSGPSQKRLTLSRNRKPRTTWKDESLEESKHALKRKLESPRRNSPEVSPNYRNSRSSVPVDICLHSESSKEGSDGPPKVHQENCCIGCKDKQEGGISEDTVHSECSADTCSYTVPESLHCSSLKAESSKAKSGPKNVSVPARTELNSAAAEHGSGCLGLVSGCKVTERGDAGPCCNVKGTPDICSQFSNNSSLHLAVGDIRSLAQNINAFSMSGGFFPDPDEDSVDSSEGKEAKVVEVDPAIGAFVGVVKEKVSQITKNAADILMASSRLLYSKKGKSGSKSSGNSDKNQRNVNDVLMAKRSSNMKLHNATAATSNEAFDGRSGAVEGWAADRRSRPKKQCPFYKKIPGTGFTVDAFNYGDVPGCTTYFLSHFHYDHYIGLTKNFKNHIYCSKVTANLLLAKIKLARTYIHTLPLDTPTVKDGVEVTFLEANHCPGAVLILFKLKTGLTHLHTGDFRANVSMETYPALQNIRVHSLFLDTTYCDPQYDFPDQSQVIQYAVKLVTDTLSTEPRTLIVCGTYTIGKERIFTAIAEALNCKICVTRDKKSVLECIEDHALKKRVSLNWADSQLHVLPMAKLKLQGLKDHLQQHGQRYSSLLAIEPTGWTFSKKHLALDQIKPKVAKDNIKIYGIPYSEHSSYREMKRFVQFIHPAKILPTVNNGNPHSRRKMEVMFEAWQEERAAIGSTVLHK